MKSTFIFLSLVSCVFAFADKKDGTKETKLHEPPRRLRDEASLEGIEKAAAALFKKNKKTFEDVKMTDDDLQRLSRDLSTKDLTKPLACAEQTMLPDDFDKFFHFPSMFLSFSNLEESEDTKLYKKQWNSAGRVGVTIAGETNAAPHLSVIDGESRLPASAYMEMEAENSKAFQKLILLRRKVAAEQTSERGLGMVYLDPQSSTNISEKSVWLRSYLPGMRYRSRGFNNIYRREVFVRRDGDGHLAVRVRYSLNNPPTYEDQTVGEVYCSSKD